MDYIHNDFYDDLLTKKCNCGGYGEMLVDCVADFVVRCSKCHRSTHAYMKPEDAATHWNNADDISEHPLHIFWDDPAGALKGQITAIHFDENPSGFLPSSKFFFWEAIIEYTDKVFFVEHHDYNGEYAIDIGQYSTFNTEIYRNALIPPKSACAYFENIKIDERGEIVRLEFSWGDSRLIIAAEKENLSISILKAPPK